MDLNLPIGLFALFAEPLKMLGHQRHESSGFHRKTCKNEKCVERPSAPSRWPLPLAEVLIFQCRSFRGEAFYTAGHNLGLHRTSPSPPWTHWAWAHSPASSRCYPATAGDFQKAVLGLEKESWQCSRVSPAAGWGLAQSLQPARWCRRPRA